MNDDNKKLENKNETIKLSETNEGGLSLRILNKLGSTDNDFLESMVNKFIHASNKGLDLTSINGSLAALVGINPQDELEAMLAAQMVTTHNLSMEMSRRAFLPDQSIEGLNDNINRMTKLMRTYTRQIEALQKYRAKGNQKITVQHVQVNDGGKAVIGDINTGGGNE